MIKAIIFDIDGVLLDSFEANFEYFQNLMKVAGYPPITKDKYVPLFHRTLHDVIQILTGVNDEKEIQRLSDLIDEVDAPPPIIAEGAPEVVEKLSDKYVLGIVTSRIKAYAYEPPLNSLKHYFKATVAYEDTENHKPYPEPLLLAAKQLGVQPEECVYIGDAESDVAAARAAGMKFVLYSKEKIGGAIVMTSDFSEIPSLVEKLK